MLRQAVAVVFIAIGVLAYGGCASVVARPATQGTIVPDAAQRLHVAVLVLTSGSVDELYQTELTRLDALCGGKPVGCRSASFKGRRLAIGILRDEPKNDARVAGTIYASLRVRRGTFEPAGWGQFETLAVALEVESRTQPGRFHEWISDVGDWSYGVHVEGVGVRGQWVHVVHPIGARGWLSPEGPVLQATAESIQGQIVRLAGVTVQWPDGSRRTAETGNYLIEAVRGRDIEFRAEVESDFACGDPVEPPKVLPPTLRSTAADFFSPDGSSRFAVVYTKGC